MLNNTTRKTINIDKTNLISLWTFKQEDDGVILLSLFKNSTALDITGQTIKLGIKRPNGTLVSIEVSETDNPFTIASNNLDIKLKNSALAIPGLLECDLELVDVNGKMTTASFFITVSKKVVGETNIAATNEIPSLEKLKSDFQTDVNNIKAEYDSFKGAQLEADKVTYFQNEVNKTNEHIAENTQQIKQLQSDIGTTANIAELKAINNEATQKMTELDSKINQIGDISNTIENVEDAKKDFNGNVKGSLAERLGSDMEYVNNRFNKASLLEYEDKYISASESFDGVTKELKIKGRTLKNLLGDSGNCEDLSKWKVGGTSVTLDTSIKMFVDKSIKVNPSNSQSFIEKDVLCDQTHKYFVSSYAYIASFTSGSLRLYCSDYLTYSYQILIDYDTTKINQWQRKSIIVTGKLGGGFRLVNGFTSSSVGTAYLEGVMIYDLTEIYGAGKEPTDIAQLERDLPYVDGIKSVGEEGKIEISSCGKNLFNEKSINLYTWSGLNWNSVYSGDVDNGLSYPAQTNLANINVKLKANKTYRVSFKWKGFVNGQSDYRYNYLQFEKNGLLYNSPISGLNYNASTGSYYNLFYNGINDMYLMGSYSFTPSEDIILKNIGTSRIWLQKNTLQLEENITNTDYEAYRENKINILLSESLRMLPIGTKDEVDIEKGNLIRRIGKKVLNGSENFTKSSNDYGSCIRFDLVVPDLVAGSPLNKLICDRLICRYNAYQDGQEGVSTNTSNSLVFFILKTNLSTQDVAGFKAWLAQNPVTVYYELATPVETTLDIQRSLRTYDKKTNIFTLGSLIEPNIYCKVPSDVVTALDTRHSTVKNKLFGSADARLEEIEQDVKNIVTQEAWIIPTLLNGATGGTGTIEPIAYRKNKLGEIEFKGELTTVATGEIFNLPSGYYNPSKNIRIPIVTLGGKSTSIQIGTTGKVSFYAIDVFSLNNIGFYIN